MSGREYLCGGCSPRLADLRALVPSALVATSYPESMMLSRSQLQTSRAYTCSFPTYPRSAEDPEWFSGCHGGHHAEHKKDAAGGATKQQDARGGRRTAYTYVSTIIPRLPGPQRTEPAVQSCLSFQMQPGRRARSSAGPCIIACGNEA